MNESKPMVSWKDLPAEERLARIQELWNEKGEYYKEQLARLLDLSEEEKLARLQELPDDDRACLTMALIAEGCVTRYALLIGVEDYTSFDPTKGKNLYAGRNDVLAYWKLCRKLGGRPRNIRVLTSPALQKADFVRAEMELSPEKGESEVSKMVGEWFNPEVVGEATRANVVQGVKWLARSLQVTMTSVVYNEDGSKESEERSNAMPHSGFLAYCGHGAQMNDDLALCPSDVTRSLANVVTFGELRSYFDEVSMSASGADEPQPTDNLTVVLDCCFAGKSSPGKKASTLTPGGQKAVRRPKRELGSRVFCASGRDETAYQAVLGGHWHSAFTWALTVTLEQWKIEDHRGFAHSTMSHSELLVRTRMLLASLSFPQHPIFVNEMANLPVFFNGRESGEEETSATPNADRPGVQLDPGGTDYDYSYYTLTDTTGSSPVVLANIMVPRTNSATTVGYYAGNEYWRVPDNSTSLSTSGVTSMTVTKEQALWSSGPTPQSNFTSFTNPQPAQWSSEPSSAAPNVGNGMFGLTASMTKSGNRWSGSVTWFYALTSVFTGPSATWTLSTSPSGSYYSSTSSV